VWSRKLPPCSILGSVADPRAVIERLTAAQNAHDLEGMVACFNEDYLSEQPVHPARTFQGVDQVRKNWSMLLQSIPDLHSELLRSAVDGDTVFVEVHWTGTKTDGTLFDERGVLIMGVRDDRIAWGRLYVDDVERESADIDAVVRAMAGTEEG
jgi:ketosteroid isomerase-like protein